MKKIWNLLKKNKLKKFNLYIAFLVKLRVIIMEVYVVFASSNYGEDIYTICLREEKAKEYCDSMNNSSKDDIFYYYLRVKVEN